MRRVVIVSVVWTYVAVLTVSLFVPLSSTVPEHCTDFQRGFYAFFGTTRDMCR